MLVDGSKLGPYEIVAPCVGPPIFARSIGRCRKVQMTKHQAKSELEWIARKHYALRI